MHRAQCRQNSIGAAQPPSQPGNHLRRANYAGSRLRSSSRRAHAVSGSLSDVDLQRLSEAAELSQSLTGVTAPHPNAGCLLFSPSGHLVGSGCQRAQGSTPSEVLAAAAAREAAQGSTAYLNLETGDCHGDEAAVSALVQAGVSRVVVGLRHPLAHLRDHAISAYTAAGLQVSVLGEAPLQQGVDAAAAEAALLSCLSANEALLHRAVLKRPLSVLKYAMTLDGKIATAAGHSAWVSSPASRAVVFEARAASDAVVVGGNTLRRDNPRLTTRRDSGHLPVRVVMSRTLDLPDAANLWDTQAAPTIVMTQRGARKHFQQALRSKGVEVVEFDFLTPEAVADYCYERGFLQVFWECGGTLAAPAIASGVIHKVLAFVAPKIIGGARAPTPVGELGNVEMTQAVNLADASWKQVGPDLMMTGYLPSSGGLLTLESACSFAGNRAAAAAAVAAGSSSNAGSSGSSSNAGSGGSSGSSSGNSSGAAARDVAALLASRNRAGSERVINFYKAWDEWGALSNFSPHPISMPVGPVLLSSSSSSEQLVLQEWTSVEHFYQSQKFVGVDHADAAAVVEAIAAAESPEEAARIGRQNERQRPELLRPDWGEAKRVVMLAALRAKFNTHGGPRQMLLSTAAAAGGASGTAAAASSKAAAAAAAVRPHQPHQQQHYMQHAVGNSSSTSSSAWGDWVGGPAVLVENSPHDKYWGQGYDGLGQNHLGQLLMQVREELLLQEEEGQQHSSLQLQDLQQQQPAAAVLQGGAQHAGHHHHHHHQQQQQQQQQHGLLHHINGKQQQEAAGHHAVVGTSAGISSNSDWQRQQQQHSSRQDAHAGLAS